MTDHKKNSGKAPSIQFYWKDWLTDTKLLRCSKTAKGVWIDLVCLSCDMPVPGVFLRKNETFSEQKLEENRAFSEQEIVQMVHGKRAENKRCFEQLKAEGVVKQFTNGQYGKAFYVKRVYEDTLLRQKRSEAGKQGGNPEFEKGKPNPYYKQEDNHDHKQEDNQKIDTSSSSSSSPSSSLKSTPLGGKKPPPKKETNPDIRKFIDRYKQYHDKTHANPLDITGGKDAVQVQRLLKTYGFDRLCVLGKAFLDGIDPWANEHGFGIGIFKVRANFVANQLDDDFTPAMRFSKGEAI